MLSKQFTSTTEVCLQLYMTRVKIHWCVSFFGVIVCRYKRRPTLGAINVLDGQNSWRDSLLHQSSIPKPCISRKHLWGPCRNNIAIRFGMEKLEWCNRPWWRKFDNMITRFETIIHKCDIQHKCTTDGLTDTEWRAKIRDIWNESYEFNSIWLSTVNVTKSIWIHAFLNLVP